MNLSYQPIKRILFLLVIVSAACNDTNKQKQTTTTKTDTVYTPPVAPVPDKEVKPEEPIVTVPAKKIYANARFKDVIVERTGDHEFVIKGKAQVFEANVSWVVEDGHNELKKGFVTTDAGAPEWGNFSFNIDVAKKRENSILTLILFESSAKDGSRQHELPIVLY